MTQVVSAIIGDRDRPKCHARQTVPTTFTMITDAGSPEAPPARRAKEPKMRPWDYSGEGPWIWIDGSVEITSPTFVADVLDLVDGPLGMFRHRSRDCIYDEVVACERFTGATSQGAHYRRCGHPERWGMWEAGVIVYRDRTEDLADAWMAELDRWSVRDQISLPFVLRRLNMRPVTLPGNIYRNQWLRVCPHLRPKEPR